MPNLAAGAACAAVALVAAAWLGIATGANGIGNAVHAAGGRRRKYVVFATIACSAVGLAALIAAFVRFFSGAASDSAERMGMYVAVFAGALLLATSALAFFRLRHAVRAAVQAHVAACPGCAVVDLVALLLCGWLGYGFVTEAAPMLGLALLLAAGGLAAALGAHLAVTIDQRYGWFGGAAWAGASARRFSGVHCGVSQRHALQVQFAWRDDTKSPDPADDFTQRWTVSLASTHSRQRSSRIVASRARSRSRSEKPRASRTRL
jgi:H+-translocating NAD(P) transhydrogenase subunit beta